MSHPAGPYLPFAPLLRASQLSGPHAIPRHSVRGDRGYETTVIADMGMSRLAAALGRHLRVLKRWKVGGVPIFSADDAAVMLGMHPCDIWGREWHDALADEAGWAELKRAEWQRNLQADRLVMGRETV